MTSEHRNLVLAVVLSAIVLFGWSALSERFFPTPRPAATGGVNPVNAPNAVPGTVPDGPTASPRIGPDGAALPPVQAGPRPLAQVLASTPRLRIETPSLLGSVNLVGLRLDDLLLRRHTQAVDTQAPVRLFAPAGALVTHDAHADREKPNARAPSNPNFGTNAPYFAGWGWAGQGAPAPDAAWTASAPVLRPGQPVTLSHTTPAGITFQLVLSVDPNYLFTATQRVVNRSGQAVTYRPYSYVNRTGTGPETDAFNLHVGPIAVLDGKLLEGDIGYEALAEDGVQQRASQGGWAGITDKFWLAAVVPAQNQRIDARFAHAPAGDRYQVDVQTPALTVPAGRQAEQVTRLFAGAKEVAAVNAVRDQYGAPLFDRSIAWGWFWFLAQPTFWLLDWLFRLFGNFGVAIIGLTVIVRTVLFPIANRQYASMAKMRIFGPKMKELQEKYKDDKLKQQQEMMELYKREKINPLAGCLPILLQIPIFYALYKTLLISIEMRHQPLALWIRDLSAPDPLTPLNLFGLLNFTPPAIIHLGILPIILGITMYAQFKLNPQPMDEIQAKVFSFMPWVFMFMMAPFAAGLQLYWIVNNLFGIAQQWVLLRRYPAPPPATAVAAKR